MSILAGLFETQATDKFEPQPWQLEDIDSLIQEKFTANWSEMGCYKTSTALWYIERLRQERLIGKIREPHVLIVTSKAGKGTYFDAFPKCIDNWKAYNVDTKNAYEIWHGEQFLCNKQDAINPIGDYPTVVLTHYDVFSRKGEMRFDLQQIEWDVIILDEAHRMKNRDTTWVKQIKKLKGEYRHIMTGTGFVNNPSEIYSLLNFINKGKWSNYWKFREHYCSEIINSAGFRIITGIKSHRLEEFRELRMGLGPRRFMADVHAGIGHPIEVARTVELNTTQRRMFNEIKSTLSTLDQQGETLRSPNVLSMLNRLRQITVATPEVLNRSFDPSTGRMYTEIDLVEPSSKLDETMDILDQIDPDQKVVVFSMFTKPLHLLGERLYAKSIPYLHMEQKHSELARYDMWKQKFPSGEYRVFMSTLALGGESINLTPAKYLIFLDRSWSPKDMMQAIGRVYRPGQVEIPEIIYINAANTTDQYMKAKLDIKEKWFDAIFNNPSN